jgi:hypothetical protein
VYQRRIDMENKQVTAFTTKRELQVYFKAPAQHVLLPTGLHARGIRRPS